MIVTATKPRRPEYAPELFLNREDEIGQFNSLVDRTIRGTAGIQRVLVFEGERGAGKSWLLQHAHWLAKQDLGVASYLIRFEPRYAGDNEDLALDVKSGIKTGESIITCELNDFEKRPEEPDDHNKTQLKSLLKDIAAYLLSAGLIAEPLPTALSLDETSLTLTRMLRNGLQSEGRVFVLLVDSAYEADWSLVSGLEDYVLAPLVALDRVAVVLSGRGRPFPWINSLLRIESMPGALLRWAEPDPDKPEAAVERQKLFGLLCQLIRKQIGKHPFWDPHGVGAGIFPDPSPQQARLDGIWKLAQGQPLLTVRLAYETGEDSSEDVQESLDQYTLNAFAIDEIFELVATDNRKEFRRYLEALSVLDFFRETEAERVIGKYDELLARDKTGISGREILARLQQTYLVRWDRDKAQFFVDDTVRITLSSWMFLARKDDWRKLHEEAQHVYESWAKAYPKHQAYYRQRAQVHALALAQAGRDGEAPTYQTVALA